MTTTGGILGESTRRGVFTPKRFERTRGHATTQLDSPQHFTAEKWLPSP